MLAPSEKTEESNISVLLVVADPEQLERTESYLRAQEGDRAWFDLATVFSMDDAFDVLEDVERSVDAIVLELAHPGIQGIDTFNALQSRAPRTPVIVMSDLRDDELARNLLKCGAQDFLPKDAVTQDMVKRSVLYAIERKAIQTKVEELNSALKTAENKLREVQLQLIQAEKMESLGRMAAGVAHEVKNPLGMLQMGIDFFSQRQDQSDVAAELMLKRMRESIERADRIVRDMVDFSRSSELTLRMDDLNLVLKKALMLTHHDLTRGKITVVGDFMKPLPEVKIDRMKIEQVLVNLITNAAHAMPGGGELKVKTYADQIETILRDEGSRSMEQLRAGDRVVVAEIRDHGEGIPEEKLGKIFDPFFTTKSTGKGTGLGLAVAKTIIDLHWGIIRIKNVNPKGVRVQLIFRAYESGATDETSMFFKRD